MDHRRPQRHRPAARRVREPRIAHVDDEIHARTHCLPRVTIGWEGIIVHAQLIGRMVGGDTDVIRRTRLQNARAEFVQPGIILRGLDLVNELAVVVRDHAALPLPLRRLKNLHIQRNVAVGDAENKER